MRRLAVRAMPYVPGLIGTRAKRLALAGAAAVMGVTLALAAHALKPDDAALRSAQDAQDAQDAEGGETIISKLKGQRTAASSTLSRLEPTAVSQLLAMALAPAGPRPEAKKEPTLQGLSEIPKELIWNREPSEDDEKEATPKAFATFSKASEQLPWDAVEPVPFTPIKAPAGTARGATAKPSAADVPHEPVKLAGVDIGSWVKAKVTEIKGNDRSRPLYHFELWLEPPADVKRRLIGVAYVFNTPAIRPQSQDSSDKTSGFRISAGGLACADEITLTLRFDDGNSEKVSVDGCKLLS